MLTRLSGSASHRVSSAFTLLELLTVGMVVAILATLILGVTGQLRAKAERANCTSNLRSLYAAGVAYVQERGQWPQIDPALVRSNKAQYAREWIAAFEPLGVSAKSWLCPTVERALKGLEERNPAHARVDYLAMPFAEGQNTPFRWPHQPWFVERGSVHGDGNMMVLTNGMVVSVDEARLLKPMPE